MWYTAFEYYLCYIVLWHVSFFSSIITITTYMLLFYSAYTVPMEPHALYYLLFTIHLLFTRLVNCDYSRLLFDYIAYSAKNMGKHCAFVIYIYKVNCTTFIFMLLRFGLLNRYNIQDITGRLFFIDLHVVKRFVWDC